MSLGVSLILEQRPCHPSLLSPQGTVTSTIEGWFNPFRCRADTYPDALLINRHTYCSFDMSY